MTDITTLRKAGMATLHEHMRTRITNTSLLTAYDTTYNLFALDACLNLGIRGHDTRLQLRRGFDPDLTKGDGIRMKDEDGQARTDEILYTVEQVDNNIMCDKIAYAMVKQMPVYFWTFTMNASSCFGVRVLREALNDERNLQHIVREQFRCKETDIPVKEWSQLDFALLHDELLESSSVTAMRIYENFWTVFRRYLIKSKEKPFGGTVTDMVDRTELQESGSAGNLPHHHTAIWLKEVNGTAEERQKLIENIRGCVNHVIYQEELDILVEDGIVSSREDAIACLEKLKIYLPHRCHTRCLRPPRGKEEERRKKRRDGNDTPKTVDGNVAVDRLLAQGYQCKVPNNHLMSQTPNAHVFRKIMRPHCPRALEMLRKLKLLTVVTDPDTGVEHEVLDESLYAVQHIPPATGEFGPISPVLARLVLLVPGNQNVQFVNCQVLARYLTKYMIMLDESNRLYVVPPNSERQEDTMWVGVEDTPNTKVTSIKMDEEQKKKNGRRNYVARIVGSPEVTMLLLNFEQVFTTFEFRRVVTAPLEERPGLDRPDPRQRLVEQGFQQRMPYSLADVDVSRLVISHCVREEWQGTNRRPFDIHALLFAKDQCFSEMTIDAVTRFGLRPPELYWVRHQRIFVESFQYYNIDLPQKRERNQSVFDQALAYGRKNLHPEYQRCAWIDAAFRLVKVRRAAVPALLKYASELTDEDFSHVGMPNAKNSVLALLTQLDRLYRQSVSSWGIRSARRQAEWTDLRKRFLCFVEQDTVPVGYYRRVPPQLGYRFAYSLLLGMGKFTTEMDITLSPTIKDAFITTGLIEANNVRESMEALIRRYVLEHMPAHGGGTIRFDDDLVTAYHVLEGILVHGHIPVTETPPVLMTRLREHQSDKVTEYIESHRSNLIHFVLKEIQDKNIQSETTIPSAEVLQKQLTLVPSSQQACWTVDHVLRSQEQSQESFDEQRACLQKVQEQLHELVHHNHISHPKSVCIVGGPGCGKTTVMTLTILHAMSMSLRCMTTALLSARASELAGIHWHILLCFPVDGNSTKTAGGLAERALANLYSYGQHQLALLQYLDVLHLDEMGPIPSMYIAAADIILRRVRKSHYFMGGLIIIATYDLFQLPPIKKMPPLLSPHMMTSFRFHELRHSVRAANDANLRELQSLTRTLPNQFTEEKRERFIHLFTTNCVFVDSFDDERIPEDAIYVFGKQEPGRQLRDKKIAAWERNSHQTPSRVAVDMERTHHTNWKHASSNVSRQLDSKTKEDRILYFRVGMSYVITSIKKGRYHNYQLCMLWDEPSQADLDQFLPVRMMVAPAGCKTCPAYRDLATKQELVQRGWKEEKITVQRERTPVKCAGGIQGRRKQYPLRLNISATLHGAMGCTLSAICSAVATDKVSPYYLWEKAQVIVLLSRTRLARDMYFVGDPKVIAEDLLSVLLRESQYFRYMLHLLDVALQRDSDSGAPVAPVITFDEHPFRPIDIPLPNDKTGYCYLLVSLKHPDVTYIGEAERLGKRLDQHNSGIGGAVQTNSLYLRPWGLLCFVAGFDHNATERKAFETEWQLKREYHRMHHGRNPTPQDLVDICCNMVLRRNQRWGRTDAQLRVIVSGRMEAQQGVELNPEAVPPPVEGVPLSVEGVPSPNEMASSVSNNDCNSSEESGDENSVSSQLPCWVAKEQHPYVVESVFSDDTESTDYGQMLTNDDSDWTSNREKGEHSDDDKNRRSTKRTDCAEDSICRTGGSRLPTRSGTGKRSTNKQCSNKRRRTSTNRRRREQGVHHSNATFNTNTTSAVDNPVHSVWAEKYTIADIPWGIPGRRRFPGITNTCAFDSTMFLFFFISRNNLWRTEHPELDSDTNSIYYKSMQYLDKKEFDRARRLVMAMANDTECTLGSAVYQKLPQNAQNRHKTLDAFCTVRDALACLLLSSTTTKNATTVTKRLRHECALCGRTKGELKKDCSGVLAGYCKWPDQIGETIERCVSQQYHQGDTATTGDLPYCGVFFQRSSTASRDGQLGDGRREIAEAIRQSVLDVEDNQNRQIQEATQQNLCLGEMLSHLELVSLPPIVPVYITSCDMNQNNTRYNDFPKVVDLVSEHDCRLFLQGIIFWNGRHFSTAVFIPQHSEWVYHDGAKQVSMLCRTDGCPLIQPENFAPVLALYERVNDKQIEVAAEARNDEVELADF